MKYFAMAGIVISCTGLGISAADSIKRKITVCRELILLCELINIDLSYNVTAAPYLLNRLLNDSRLRHLNFIDTGLLKKKRELKSCLSDEINEKTADFIFSFGKSDRESQIKLVNSYRKGIEKILAEYEETYKRDSRLYIAFGFFGGLAVAVMML